MGMAHSQIMSVSTIIDDDGDRSSAPISPTTSTASSSSSSAVMVSHELIDSDDEFVDCNSEFFLVVEPIVSSSSSNSAVQQIALGPADSTRDETHDEDYDDDATDDESHEKRRERQRKEMDEFREDMRQKREVRHAHMKRLKEEMLDLREKLAQEVETSTKLRETVELYGAGGKSVEEITNENKRLRFELAECQMFLQTSNGENINKTLEVQALRDHIRSLKEVIKATKEMLNIRECQVNQMKSKLTEIEQSFSEKETQLMSKALQQEYQEQLDNIRKMRELYEQRAELLAKERDMFKRKFEEKEHDLETEQGKSKKLEDYIATLENNVSLKNDDISHLESEISNLKSQKSQVSAEMTAVNQLIAQVLLGFDASGSFIDIDKLVSMLEQNRDLLNEMAIQEDYAGIDEGSFLPKLLFDIFLQANEPAQQKESSTEQDANATSATDTQQQMRTTPEEIVEKLPKVWRVLTELLSHQNELASTTIDADEEKILDNCYKTIQTASGGTQNVLSVSKTFTKLKDLIIEKRSLLKDTGRLKTLYRHLEQRLDKQEKKLSSISLELMKTWHLVGKLKRQHRQLHTHEQILCYQMQQKRRVLNELKAELEYCRKKWALARALTNDSEEQCKQLRHEFTERKKQDQQSGESGYSDEHQSDDEVTPRAAAMRSQKFDENLILFDRTASPTFLDRRQSESPVHDFTDPLCLIVRAHSEPPHLPPTSAGHYTSVSASESEEIEMESYEILDMIPDPVAEPEVRLAATTIVDDRSSLVVTPPPEVHCDDAAATPPRLRAQLRRCKKEERRRERAKNRQETAEDLFVRLMNQGRSECDTCSSTTVSIDEDDFENLDEIQEIPLDDVIEEEDELMVVEDKHETVDEPSTAACSSDKNDFEILSEKEQEFLQRREIRMQRLEAEAKAFYDKMAKNREKGQQLDNHLNQVHQIFLHRNRERTKSSDDETKRDDESDGATTSRAAAANQDCDNDDDGDEMEQK